MQNILKGIRVSRQKKKANVNKRKRATLLVYCGWGELDTKQAAS